MKKATLIKYAVLLLILLLATLFIVRRCRHQPQAEEPTLTIADTPLTVEDVKPIGELYLYTTVTEDVETGSFMGSGYGSSSSGLESGLIHSSTRSSGRMRGILSWMLLSSTVGSLVRITKTG